MLIRKLKFIKVHLVNLESKFKIYYIRRDVPYEKRRSREKFYLLIVLLGVKVYSKAVRDGV